MDGKEVNEVILKIAKNNKAVAKLVEAKWVALIEAEQELNTCKKCEGTGKRKITFEDCFGNPIPEKTVYLNCDCESVER